MTIIRPVYCFACCGKADGRTVPICEYHARDYKEICTLFTEAVGRDRRLQSYSPARYVRQIVTLTGKLSAEEWRKVLQNAR